MLLEVKRFLGSEALNAGGWSLAETALLAAVFAFAAYIIPKATEKASLNLEKRFFRSTAPYAFLVAALTVIFSPLVGSIMGVVTIIVSLFISHEASSLTGLEKLSFYRTFGFITALMTLPLLDFSPALTSATVFIPFAGAAVFLSRFLNKAPVYAVAGQYFDAATSFVVLSTGGTELHLLGSYFVELFGPHGIFAMKTLVVLPATVYIYRQSCGKRTLYYMFIIGFLGLALGLANLFRA